MTWRWHFDWLFFICICSSSVFESNINGRVDEYYFCFGFPMSIFVVSYVFHHNFVPFTNYEWIHRICPVFLFLVDRFLAERILYLGHLACKVLYQFTHSQFVHKRLQFDFFWGTACQQTWLEAQQNFFFSYFDDQGRLSAQIEWNISFPIEKYHSDKFSMVSFNLVRLIGYHILMKISFQLFLQRNQLMIHHRPEYQLEFHSLLYPTKCIESPSRNIIDF